MGARRVNALKGIACVAHPYKWSILVLQGGEIEQVNRYVARQLGTDEANGIDKLCAGHCWVYSGRPAIIWVRSVKDVPELVHELMHVAFGILEGRGLKHHEASEEAYTYLVEDLLRRILKTKTRQWSVIK